MYDITVPTTSQLLTVNSWLVSKFKDCVTRIAFTPLSFAALDHSGRIIYDVKSTDSASIYNAFNLKH